MARTWLQIRVELEGGGGIVCDPRPGRVFIVGPGHTFRQPADAINDGFAPWDRGHLHDLELDDGRLIGLPNEDFEEPGYLDHAALKVTREVKPGDRFVYTFDLGDNWRDACTIRPPTAATAFGATTPTTVTRTASRATPSGG